MQSTLYAKDLGLSGILKILVSHILAYFSDQTVNRKASVKFLVFWFIVSKDFEKLVEYTSEPFSVMSLQEYQSLIFYIQDL